MKISGVATLHARAEEVWTALNDPAVLARAIPGCERVEATGRDSCRITMTAGMASAQGTYTGEVSVSERREPVSFALTAQAVGEPGTVGASVQVRLTAADGGSTQLSYDADAVVGGAIAGVGQRMLASVAQRMAGEFFASVNGVLTGEGAAAASAVPVSTGAPPAVPGAAFTGHAPAPAAPATVAGDLGSNAPGPPPAAPAAVPGPATGGQVFARGVLVGTAIGVALGRLLRRRAR